MGAIINEHPARHMRYKTWESSVCCVRPSNEKDGKKIEG